MEPIARLSCPEDPEHQYLASLDMRFVKTGTVQMRFPTSVHRLSLSCCRVWDEGASKKALDKV
jgi:hypothetical protein